MEGALVGMSDDVAVTEEDSVITGAGFNKKIDARFLVITLLLKIQQIVSAPQLNKTAYKESVDFLGRIMCQADDTAYKSYRKDMDVMVWNRDKEISGLTQPQQPSMATERPIFEEIESVAEKFRKIESIHKRFLDDKFERLVMLLDIKNLLLDSDVTERVKIPKRKEKNSDFEMPDDFKGEI
jgi:hypothetical protein